ncbi:MAG TPA: hypothetical protein VFS34_02685 [Thermoanaerobaculia bacterium]|nr:hypothetical protein [Thermoanaerobaculia bacterium]
MADSRRLQRIRRAILAIGFAAAIVIYVVAGPDADNPNGYDPMQNKMYLHDLELYGGKANILAAEFRDWFVELWQGRTLAFTVAFLTVLIFLGMRFVARFPREYEDDAPGVHRGPWRDRG